MSIIKRRRGEGASGLALVEIMVSLSIFAILVLSVSLALVHGIRQRRESFQFYRALSAIRDKVAEIQETANLPQDLANNRGIGAVYAKYHSKSFAVPDLPSGQVTITCYPDETSVPAVLGGPQDLNFDGDPDDNLGNISNGTDLKLVPLILVCTFVDNATPSSVAMHRLITKTTN